MGIWDMGNASSDLKSGSSLFGGASPWKTPFTTDHLVATGLGRLWVTGRTLKERCRTTQASNSQGEKAAERPLPRRVSLFLPEFPIWQPAQHQELKILGCVAKGSFGPVLKVLDCTHQQMYALKVLPKDEVLRRKTLKQCKEEVSIQRQVKHPFIQCLGNSWQGRKHLFIMCSYCSFGDLYSLWTSTKSIDEDTSIVCVAVFGKESSLRALKSCSVIPLMTFLISPIYLPFVCLSPPVLKASPSPSDYKYSIPHSTVYLHDLGIVHRDVKMENILLDERGHLKLSDFGLAKHLPLGERTSTICGTLQYMAPEVLSGGPYSHSADWWSLGVLMFALSIGEFPVIPEKDHMSMLESVTQATYDVPVCLSQGLSHLLKELLCRFPRQRIRYLHQFKSHCFFRSFVFDPVLLQKFPVDLVMKLRRSEMTDFQSISVFEDFDCELTGTVDVPCPA